MVQRLAIAENHVDKMDIFARLQKQTKVKGEIEPGNQ